MTATKRFAPIVAVLVALAMVLALPLRAGEAPPRQYLPLGAVVVEDLIPPPPAMDSAAFAEEIAVVLWLQQARTPEQVAFVEKTLNVERFAPILGDELMRVDGLALKQIIDQAIDEVRQDYDAVKAVYDLPRPFQVSDAVEPVGDARPVASYPSGHSIRAMVYARLLAEVFPDHEAALMDLAHQVGYGRVTAGVHYPIDVTTGQTLGNAFADAIVAEPAFQDAVAHIQAG